MSDAERRGVEVAGNDRGREKERGAVDGLSGMAEFVARWCVVQGNKGGHTSSSPNLCTVHIMAGLKPPSLRACSVHDTHSPNQSPHSRIIGQRRSGEKFAGYDLAPF